jgi:hypothetical protein
VSSNSEEEAEANPDGLSIVNLFANGAIAREHIFLIRPDSYDVVE